MSPARIVFAFAATAALFSVLAFGFGAPALAEDLSDNETCLECHEGQDRAPPSNPARPQVHNPDGGFFVEDHDMWSLRITKSTARTATMRPRPSKTGNTTSQKSPGIRGFSIVINTLSCEIFFIDTCIKNLYAVNAIYNTDF